MLQDQDALRKVGRGGAGNYYTPKQVDEASKEPNVAAAVPPNTSSHGPARAGRGGAGNFFDPAQHRREQEQLADETAAAVTLNLKKHPHRGGLSGRGGPGNFNNEGAAEHARQQEEEGRSKITDLERKVKEAVERGLRMPEKVHHGVSKHEQT